jgi:hypothetical protein
MKAAADDISADVDRTEYVRCTLAPTYRWYLAADLAGRCLSRHCLPGSGQVAEAINTPEQPSDQESLRLPDGGNRTASLLIRRFLYRHPAPFRSVRDLGLATARCSCEPGTSEGCSSSWLPGTDPRPSAFRPDISPFDANRTSVMRCSRLLLLPSGCCCCY